MNYLNDPILLMPARIKASGFSLESLTHLQTVARRTMDAALRHDKKMALTNDALDRSERLHALSDHAFEQYNNAMKKVMGVPAPPEVAHKRRDVAMLVALLTGAPPDMEGGPECADGCWVYHYGWNNQSMGPSCHLIHEGTWDECWDVLDLGLVACECGDCGPKTKDQK